MDEGPNTEPSSPGGTSEELVARIAERAVELASGATPRADVDIPAWQALGIGWVPGFMPDTAFSEFANMMKGQRFDPRWVAELRHLANDDPHVLQGAGRWLAEHHPGDRVADELLLDAWLAALRKRASSDPPS
jgi:hypothetical protein